jgi:FkbM family methyltransferase
MLASVPVGRNVCDEVVDAAMNVKRDVQHASLRMTFAAPNALNRYRVATFATKEPDTLTWLETIPRDAVLWDVGANIGLYSVYAATARSCRVYAFEPSVFNLELLARNIASNGLQEYVTIVPLALTDRLGLSSFKLSTTTWGGALSTFGEDFGQDGRTLNKLFEYRTIGLSMHDAVVLLGIPRPEYIKIDVDGIEHFILRGSGDVLSSVQSVLVEINDEFREQAEETTQVLRHAGLSLHRKCDLGVPHQYNQWWVRTAATNGGGA